MPDRFTIKSSRGKILLNTARLSEVRLWLACYNGDPKDLRVLADPTFTAAEIELLGLAERKCPQYVEVPLIGGPRDGRVAKFRVGKDGSYKLPPCLFLRIRAKGELKEAEYQSDDKTHT